MKAVQLHTITSLRVTALSFLRLQIEGIAPWPLEGGAELIHGEDSIVRKLTQSDQKGVEIPAKAADVVNYVFWADTEELVSLEEGVPELERVNSIFSAVSCTALQHGSLSFLVAGFSCSLLDIRPAM